MHMALILILSLLCGLAFTAVLKTRDPEEEHDHEKSFAEYLTSYGYNFEVHKAVTKDGYLITLWRIPKKISEKRSSRHPVLLQHGVMDNAFSWLYKNMYKNLPIMLVDLGYDVWLGNNRGTIHSLEHVDIQGHNHRRISGKYWEFSFDEMGLYDLPAMIDYISDITGQPKVTYIGHSQGTSQFFAKSMVDPDYINNKIAAFVGLSPVLYVQHAPGMFLQILDWLHVVDLLYYFNLGNFWTFPMLLPINEFILKYIPGLMPPIVQMIAGTTKNQTLDLTRMTRLGTSEPGGTSVQNLMHWIQIYRKGGVRMMDFGYEGNMKKYGKADPPEYDVTKLKTLKIPIMVMAGSCDNLIGWTDLAKLLKLLPSNHQYHDIEDYGHLDYIWADDAHVKIYPKLIKFLSASLIH